ncbi:O-antigen/teichoic acid export membrane protein [Paraburkholderia sp. BL6669N2]|uniref:glycosyltransferase n=1 Tax=Paraburkholderia sp. BL6669N2 TaxID=1938807 RepID=UPI000E21D385|nr:glycosyltransferase [Paraburkholderia sp. BL6669N2]REG50339.1 O-antigen/teichoic acid export membrane protein [Paraburkholderia sp. BL6669N2]
MNLRFRDARAVSLLSVSALASAGLAFAVQAMLARSLSSAEYGRFATALAVVTIIAPAVGFGVPSFWLKAYGTEGWAARRWMAPSMSFVVRSAFVCLIGGAIWACLGMPDRRTRDLLLLMLPVVLTQGAVEMSSVKLQLEERFGRVAMWQALQHAGRLVLVALCWQLGAGSEAIALGFGCVGALVTLGAWQSISLLRSGEAELVGHGSKSGAGDMNRVLPTPSVAELWRSAMPFGVSGLLFFAYGQSGLLIVSHLGTPQDVGIYGVAVTILTALYLLPTVLFQKLLMPRFHRWAASGDERLERAYRVGNKWMFALGVVLAGIAVLLAPTAIPLVFGKQYEQSVCVVAFMTLSAPFRFLTVSASSVMTTRDLIQVRNRCAAVALLFSLIAGIIGVLRAGIAGAAAASVAGEILWAALSLLCARHFLSEPQRKPAPASEVLRRAQKALQSLCEHAPVSVVIPCFNCCDTIGRAVESVFRQTCRPQELILVDDCSTDGTRKYLGELIQAYPSNWIRIVQQPRNAGPGAARNAAWAIATQPYIAFLDSDDSWHPAKVAIQYGWMAAHPDVAITGHPVAQLKSGEQFDAQPGPTTTVPYHVSRWRILFSNRFTPSSIMVRQDVSARFDEKKRHAEDYFMLLEVVLMDGGKAYLFPSRLSHVYKAQFGAQTGLSAQLWNIQKGEQDNYLAFRKRGLVSNVEWLCFSLLSMLKYLRRCVLSRRFT